MKCFETELNELTNMKQNKQKDDCNMNKWNVWNRKKQNN